MRKNKTESAAIVARVCGEMAADSIPVTPSIDVAALKAGDDDPMEVVVSVPVGKSKRGWNYTAQAITDVVNKVNSDGLGGFKGHRKAEEVPNVFPDPVTHWVGAKFQNDTAYFRGVVDKSASDLKRWIRAGAIKTVSIFGNMKLQQLAGETNVIGCDPMSIDWAPLGREGMPTKIVAVGEMDDTTGEMDDTTGEMDGSHEELREAIRDAAITKLGGGYCYVRKVFDDSTILEHEPATVGNTPAVNKLYSIPYGVVDDAVQLGEPKEVTEQRIYVPVGEMEDDTMKWTELVTKLKSAVESGETTIEQVAGEMGIAAGSGDSDAQTLATVREALAISGEMDIVAVAKEAGAAIQAKAKADFDSLVSEVLTTKVTGEMGQAIVRRMIKAQPGATREEIAGELDALLADASVTGMISKLHTDGPTFIGGSPASETFQGVTVKRSAIV